MSKLSLVHPCSDLGSIPPSIRNYISITSPHCGKQTQKNSCMKVKFWSHQQDCEALDVRFNLHQHSVFPGHLPSEPSWAHTCSVCLSGCIRGRSTLLQPLRASVRGAQREHVFEEECVHWIFHVFQHSCMSSLHIIVSDSFAFILRRAHILSLSLSSALFPSLIRLSAPERWQR